MDIRNYFHNNEIEINSDRPNRKKRPYELPMDTAYEGFFPKGQPKPAGEPMVGPRKKKESESRSGQTFSEDAL